MRQTEQTKVSKLLKKATHVQKVEVQGNQASILCLVAGSKTVFYLITNDCNILIESTSIDIIISRVQLMNSQYQHSVLKEKWEKEKQQMEEKEWNFALKCNNCKRKDSCPFVDLSAIQKEILCREPEIKNVFIEISAREMIKKSYYLNILQ